MNTAIYRCSKKDEMYLYLSLNDDEVGEPTAERQEQLLKDVPESLKNTLGRLTYVMQLDLSTRDRLARAPLDNVKLSLASKGYYIQLPPEGLINPNAVAPEGLRGA